MTAVLPTVIGYFGDIRRNAIRWCSRTHNFFRGCSAVSEGCANCYAAEEGDHQCRMNPASPYSRLVVVGASKSRWTGVVEPTAAKAWVAPFRTRQRWLAFIDSMSDVFHHKIPDAWVLLLFQTLHLARWHTFQVVTKRADRMASFMSRLGERDGMLYLSDTALPRSDQAVLPNVWLGVSAENQKRADERLPLLLSVNATVRFVSAEPLLGPVDLIAYLRQGIHWVIVGGESGENCRPMDLAWARQLRDQCVASGTPFFYKQLAGVNPNLLPKQLDGRRWEQLPMRPLLPIPSDAERKQLIKWAEAEQGRLRSGHEAKP